MTNQNTRRGFTQIKRVGQALPDNAPAKGHLAAFTLIELLVVVLIIGILAAVALPQYKLSVAKSRFTQIMILGDSLWKAQKMYYLANGQYATTIKQLDIGMPGGETGTSGSYNGGYCALQESQLYCIGLDNKVIYVRIYNEKRRLCRNESKDAFIRKLCLSLGGTSANTSNGIEQYVLP